MSGLLRLFAGLCSMVGLGLSLRWGAQIAAVAHDDRAVGEAFYAGLFFGSCLTTLIVVWAMSGWRVLFK